jgi:hypothetical protein
VLDFDLLSSGRQKMQPGTALREAAAVGIEALDQGDVKEFATPEAFESWLDERWEAALADQ